MGATEITEFLTDLAVNGKVSASTQNQAFFSLLFLYRDVLRINLPNIEGVIRAKRPEHLPVVFTPNEAKAILANLKGVPLSGSEFIIRRRFEIDGSIAFARQRY